MVKQRSPRSPSIGLTGALARSKQVWDNVQKSPVSQDEIAAIWSYSSVSGPVRSQIAALRNYGLLVSEKGSLRLSDLAITLMVHPVDSEEYRSALRTAAFNPPMFAKVWKERRSADNRSLRAYLITKEGFSTKGAGRFIEAYRDTIALAKPEGLDYDSDGEDGEREMKTPDPSTTATLKQPGTSQDIFTLQEGQAVFRWPNRLSRQSFDDLKSWIELVVRKLERTLTDD